MSGILGAYLVLFPRARIMSLVPSYYFMRVARVPAAVFIGFWFVLQLLYGGGATAVAYMAHIGGFLIGLIAAKTVKVRRPDRPRIAPSSTRVSPQVLTSFCEYCGARLPSNALFCPNCGRQRIR